MEECNCITHFEDGYQKGREAERARIIEVLKTPVPFGTKRTFMITLSEEQLNSLYGVSPHKATRKLRLVK